LADSRADFARAISRVLSNDEPIALEASETAAVAIIFGRDVGREELLLIRRSERENDPWSGQIALPGGRAEKGDGSFRDTAVRETREEVGMDLEAEARFLGYLGSFQARTRSIWVVPSVFISDRLPTVSPNIEVASARWVPFEEFIAPASRSTYHVKRGAESRAIPAFKIEDYLIWGLTERIISAMVEALRQRKPDTS
jgi:8-oxo-dGTP pyrophosphatase MutT (NUDIX family)